MGYFLKIAHFFTSTKVNLVVINGFKLQAKLHLTNTFQLPSTKAKLLIISNNK